MQLSLGGVLIIVTTTIAAICVAVVVYAQARLEIRPVDTVTLTSEQFLTGDAHHKPVTLAGELRTSVCDPRYFTCSAGAAGPANYLRSS